MKHDVGEITTTTEMAGLPPQSVTHIQYVTEDDLVPVSDDAQQECEVTDIEIDGEAIPFPGRSSAKEREARYGVCSNKI
ncbi:MAG TPA: hypothetical protein ENN79_13975, partial [Desulfobacteraceae bacterium]|nr:hypothetical protein [Desulfobacteraceae bacterium]